MSMEMKISGLTFKNPLILGSAGYAEDENGIKRFITRGYAGLVTKSTSKDPLSGAPPPRVFWYYPYKKAWIDGAEGHRNPGIDKMAGAVKACKDLADKEDFHIIGSVSFNSVEEAQYVASKYEAAGVSAIELDMVCTNVGPHLGADFSTRGIYWAEPEHPERTIELIKAVKSAVDIPVWTKIYPVTLFRNETIEKESKVDAFVCEGDRMAGLAIDLDTGLPLFNGNVQLKIRKKIKFGLYTQPILCATVLSAALTKSKLKVPIISTGGIACGFDVLQAMMAGAEAVEICTAVYRDMNIGESMLREISWFLSKHGYASLNEIVGIAVKHIPFDLMNIPPALT